MGIGCLGFRGDMINPSQASRQTTVFSCFNHLGMNVPLTVPDLLDNAARLGTNEFESFFKVMLALRAKRIAPVLSDEEHNLLEKIYSKLPVSTTDLYEKLKS